MAKSVLSLQERLERNEAVARETFRRKHQHKIDFLLSIAAPTQLESVHPYNDIQQYQATIRAALQFYGNHEVFKPVVAHLRRLRFERNKTTVFIGLAPEEEPKPNDPAISSLDTTFDPDTFSLG